MADVNYDLKSGEACKGENGLYVAKTYFLTQREHAESKEFNFKDKLPPPRTLRAFYNRLLGENPAEAREKLIGVSLLRLCFAVRHSEPVLERVNSIGIVNDPDAPIPIRPGTARAHDGIGAATSQDETMITLQPMIDFPVTHDERIKHPVSEVFPASFSRPGQRAYIAVRGLEDFMTVEQFREH